MQKGAFKRLWWAVLGVCALGGVAWAQGPWDPAEHLVPFWDSVELQARVVNPARNADADAEPRLAIRAGVEMMDYEDVIGISQRERGVVVLDQDGTEIHRSEDAQRSRWYRETDNILNRIGMEEGADEFSISVSVPLDPNAAYPTSLSRVEWITDVLIAETFMTVDIPFEASEVWIEPVPGLEILVEAASAAEGSYTYRIKAIHDPEAVAFGSTSSWHLWSDEVPPATMLIGMDMLNAAGEPVWERGTSGGFSRGSSGHGTEDGLMETTSTGTGRCSACGDVTTIRYTFALDPYEVEARMALEDVPVPGF